MGLSPGTNHVDRQLPSISAALAGRPASSCSTRPVQGIPEAKHSFAAKIFLLILFFFQKEKNGCLYASGTL